MSECSPFDGGARFAFTLLLPSFSLFFRFTLLVSCLSIFLCTSHLYSLFCVVIVSSFSFRLNSAFGPHDPALVLVVSSCHCNRIYRINRVTMTLFQFISPCLHLHLLHLTFSISRSTSREGMLFDRNFPLNDN